MWQLSEEGGDAITSLQWNPNPSHQVVAAAVGNVVVLIATGTGERESVGVGEREKLFFYLSFFCLFT